MCQIHPSLISYSKVILEELYETENPHIAKGMLADLIVILYDEDQHKEVKWLAKKFRKYNSYSGEFDD